MIQRFVLLAALVMIAAGPVAWAAEEVKSPAAPAAESTPADAESVEVSSIKEKYWALGDGTEMGVIQNRIFSKTKKFQLGILGGSVSSDPFLNVQHIGGNIGFHITEYIAIEVLGMKYYSQPSSALDTFKKFRGATVNTNLPQYYLGGELMASLLYGKLSLVGQAIIYYDLHLLAGAGMMRTESGDNLSISPGIGQRFYINRLMSIRMDYRLLRYNETIIEKEIPTKLGQRLGDRVNWSHTVNVGLDFMFGGGK